MSNRSVKLLAVLAASFAAAMPAGLGDIFRNMPLPAGFGEAVLAFDGCLWVPLSDGTVLRLAEDRFLVLNEAYQ